MSPTTKYCANNPLMKTCIESDYHQSVIREIKAIQSKHSIDQFFILSHLGLYPDQDELYDDKKLTESLAKNGYSNVAIFGGHTHLLPDEKPVYFDGIPVINSASHVRGYTEVRVNQHGELIFNEPVLTRTNSDDEKDPEITEIDSQYREICQSNIRIEGIRLDAPLSDQPITVKIQAEDIRFHNTFIMNTAADALAEQFKSPIAFYPRGAILPPHLETVETQAQFLEIFYASNKIVPNIQLSGRKIKTVIQEGLNQAPSTLQPSKGFSYQYDLATKQVLSMTFQGKPIEHNCQYTITTTDWIYNKLIKKHLSQVEMKEIPDDQATIGEYVLSYILKHHIPIHWLFSSDSKCDERVLDNRQCSLRVA